MIMRWTRKNVDKMKRLGMKICIMILVVDVSDGG